MQNDRPVAYASRKLTPIEKRYSNSEREMLSVVFAFNPFSKADHWHTLCCS